MSESAPEAQGVSKEYRFTDEYPDNARIRLVLDLRADEADDLIDRIEEMQLDKAEAWTTMPADRRHKFPYGVEYHAKRVKGTMARFRNEGDAKAMSALWNALWRWNREIVAREAKKTIEAMPTAEEMKQQLDQQIKTRLAREYEQIRAGMEAS